MTLRNSTISEIERRLLTPPTLRSGSDILRQPSLIPARPGIYAWYFEKPPLALALEGAHRSLGHYLLYLGVSPSNESSNGSLRQRIMGHLTGNAANSTLRLTLGSLLAAELGLQPMLSRSGRKMNFGEGEKRLDAWLKVNAFVTWAERREPWKIEAQLIARLRPPLNITRNVAGPNLAIVKASRDYLRKIAQRV